MKYSELARGMCRNVHHSSCIACIESRDSLRGIIHLSVLHRDTSHLRAMDNDYSNSDPLLSIGGRHALYFNLLYIL